MANNDTAARSFTHFVAELGSGDFNADASDMLNELNKALSDAALAMSTKVKGTLTIKFKLTCDQKGAQGIDFDIKSEKPRIKRPTYQAWADPKSGNVLFEPPRQMKLPLREVNTTREVRDVDNDNNANVREV